MCIFHGLTVNDITITTHRQSYLDGYGGNHGDPWHIWRFIGYDLDQFRKDVQKYIDAKKGDVLALMTKQEFEQILEQKLASVKPPFIRPSTTCLTTPRRSCRSWSMSRR